MLFSFRRKDKAVISLIEKGVIKLDYPNKPSEEYLFRFNLKSDFGFYSFEKFVKLEQILPTYSNVDKVMQLFEIKANDLKDKLILLNFICKERERLINTLNSLKFKPQKDSKSDYSDLGYYNIIRLLTKGDISKNAEIEKAPFYDIFMELKSLGKDSFNY